MRNITNKKFHNLYEGCICVLLNDPEVIICQNIFHNNICSLHYKYSKINICEKELYQKTGRNFFIDLVEYNIIKQKIRNETIGFLMEYLKNYFGNL
jgi:hypothetical protein